MSETIGPSNKEITTDLKAKGTELWNAYEGLKRQREAVQERCATNIVGLLVETDPLERIRVLQEIKAINAEAEPIHVEAIAADWQVFEVEELARRDRSPIGRQLSVEVGTLAVAA